LKDFVQQCLKKNPKDRPTAAELLQHPFVTTNYPANILTEVVIASRQVREEKRAVKEKKRREPKQT
jgi:serine/threonine protein kinase